MATIVWEPLIPEDAVTIFSGGTEGVLSPHVTFVLRSSSQDTGLKGIVGHTRKFMPHEIGSDIQARVVAEEVTRLVAGLSISTEQVHLVLIKCPLLTTAEIASIRSEGRVPVTTDTYESMDYSRRMSAIGIAKALGEIDEMSFERALGTNKEDLELFWSAKASCSSGAELDDCHIFILASEDVTTSSAAGAEPAQFHACSGYMADAIDASSVISLLDRVKAEEGRVVQVFAKAEANPSGLVRGSRHTMNTDSDLHSTRHARAAVGGLIAGLTSDCEIYVSGGAEGQGPAGGGSLCVVYRVDTT